MPKLSQLPEGGKTTEEKDCVEDVYIWARNKLELSLTGSKVKGTWEVVVCNGCTHAGITFGKVASDPF